jgi:outer membrane cobalamin receptor
MMRREVLLICWLLVLPSFTRAEEPSPPPTEPDATDAAIDLPSDDEALPRRRVDGDRIELFGRAIQRDFPVARPVTDGVAVDRYGHQITIVTDQQVDDLNAQDLPSALRRTPGVVISRHNQIGSFGGGDGGAIVLRGQGAERPGASIQTLVDGVPRFVGVWTHPLMDTLSVDGIERIDVYKGAEPLRFGNMSFGAVNLIPKRQREEGFSGRVRVGWGNYSTLIQTAETGGKTGDFDYYLTQSFRKSHGHRKDADGQIQDYKARLGYQFGESWYASLLLDATNNWADDPGPEDHRELRDGRFDTEDYLALVKLEHEHPYARGSLRAYSNPAGTRFDTLTDYDNFGVRARESLNLWGGGEILFGMDFDWYGGNARTRGGNPPAPARFDRKTYRLLSPTLAVSQSFDLGHGWSAVPSAGVRFYDHSEYDDEWAPLAGLVITRRGTTFHAAYSRGLNYPGVYVEALNVLSPFANDTGMLGPEKIDHFEVGVVQEFGPHTQASLTLFRDDGKNRLFMFERPFTPPPFPAFRLYFENVPDFRTQGIEATVTTSPLPNLSFFIGGTFLDAKPHDLPYTPTVQASAGVNWRFLERFKLSVDALYLDDYEQADPRNGDPSATVGDFFLLNARLGYELPLPSDRVTAELFVAGENLTNTNYEYKQGYPMPGINGMIGATVSF